MPKTIENMTFYALFGPILKSIFPTRLILLDHITYTIFQKGLDNLGMGNETC